MVDFDICYQSPGRRMQPAARRDGARVLQRAVQPLQGQCHLRAVHVIAKGAGRKGQQGAHQP